MHDLKPFNWEPEENNSPVRLEQVVNGWLGSCRQRLMFMALALDLACRMHGASCARQAWQQQTAHLLMTMEMK